MSIDSILGDFDLLKPMVMRASAQSGLFDIVASSQLTFDEIVESLDYLDPYTLRLLIQALDEYGYMLIKNDKVLLTELGKTLARNIAFINSVTSRSTASGLFSYAPLALHERLERGANYFELSHKEQYWQLVNRDPNLYASFEQGYSGNFDSDSLLDRAQLTKTDELFKARNILELGSGYGDTAYFILKSGFSGNITVSDLSNRIPVLTAQSRWQDFQGRVYISAIDFFTDPIPHHSTILLDSILADWDDDQCIILFRRIRSAIKENSGKLVISEVTRFSNDDGIDAIGKLTLACAVSGRVRSEEEVENLIRTAGYTKITLAGSSEHRFTLVAY